MMAAYQMRHHALFDKRLGDVNQMGLCPNLKGRDYD